MLNKILSLVSCLLFSGLAIAQAPEKVLGRSVDVRGLVTVSNGKEVAGVVEGAMVVDRTRYVTSSTGSVTLKFEHCEVKLKPNEAVMVDERKICDGMIAGIERLGGVAVAGGNHLLGGLVVMVGLGLLDGGHQGGSAAGAPTPTEPGGGGGVPTFPPISAQ